MNLLKPIASLSLLLVLPLLAEENHAPVGIEQQTKESYPQSEIALIEEEELDSAGFIFDRYPPIYHATAHHWLNAIAEAENNQHTLELEDGSVWKISSYDAKHKALHWRTNDPLTITQNNRWFSKHTYRIVNKNNGTSVEANLFLGPVTTGEYAKFITTIDLEERVIILNDHTHWKLSPSDASIMKDWNPNHYIILGTNSNVSFWDSESDALLINVTRNKFARAKQI